MLNAPFSPWPDFTQEEADTIQSVLLSNRVNYWTGHECREFEKEFASWVDSEYAIALANGTVALELALKALAIGPGDEVIVTPRTFIASVSCIVMVGAKPVFADVDAESQNITAATIRTVITPRTRAIICVHLAGLPCDMDSIMAIANEHNIKVIEDCAQAHGARYKGRSVGSIGDIGAWSFCQDKIMTTGGEGGMVTTNDRDLWSRMWSYKDHGKSWEAVYERKHSSGTGFRWLHGSFGTNFRMMEIQAAIGRIQLRSMANWTRQRTVNAERISEVLCKYPSVRFTKVPEGFKHAWYKFYAFVLPEALSDGWNRNNLINEINMMAVPCYSGSCPEVYLEHAFDGTDFRPSDRLPVAKHLGETSLMLLVHPTLTGTEINKTCHVLEDVLSRATR